ncbi:hypothetical protein MNBD_BACTEROID05-877 [hydrothermal vent metagenome]|uniref:Outer membrane receptor for ferric coprogen and ferric-rhodotorulic acid n=1 Tax=hydrothermal vent metagenome TaxID=652676 RepID=A0A3B0TC15_9ZZZZ
MKRTGVFIIGVSVSLLIFMGTSVGYAESDVDILLRKFVERGIVSSNVAKEIKEEIRVEKMDSSTVPVGIENRVSALEKKKISLPKWVEKTKLKGDFRLRYEHKEREGRNDVERGRIRYRLGIESKVVDKVVVGLGIASGSNSSTSARSTNQDLQDVFSTKPFNLDYAFAEYTPTDWVSIIGGKFKRKKYLWEPGDLLWDTDINPEGGSIQLRHELKDSVNVYTNAGVWILDESTSDPSDPYLFYVQSGVKLKDDDSGTDAQVAFTYYSFDSVKGATLDGALGDNTADSNGDLLYKYTPIVVSAEAGIKEPFDLPIPRVAAFGEFVHNPDPVDENNGWLLGLKLGDKKVNNTRKWQLKYLFARLEKDAFLDVLPDADRYSGGTDIVSHEGILQIGLKKNVMLEFDYYSSNRVNGISKPEKILQTSMNFKF